MPHYCLLNVIARTILGLILLSTGSSQSAPQIKILAPYGYVWGQFPTTVKNLRECYQPRAKLLLCKTIDPPRPRADGKHYWLMFTKKNGLISVVYTSHHITGDLAGKEGRRRFARLKQKFKKQYPTRAQKDIAFLRPGALPPAGFYGLYTRSGLRAICFSSGR